MAALELDRLDATTLRARRSLKWNRYPQDVLPMWVAELDFPTAEPVQRALEVAVRDEVYGYPRLADGSGLGAVTADYQGTAYGWDVAPEQVRLVGDVMHGIRLALSLTEPGGTIVVPTPVYMPFFETITLSGREQVHVPMLPTGGVGETGGSGASGASGASWALDLDGIDAALAVSGGTVLLCSPHNPLGHAFSRAELEALAAVVERRGARVISDEIHAPLVFEGTHLPYAAVTPAAARHTVTVTSASKAWNLPGLKCAQVITAVEEVERWDAIPFEATIGTGILGIVANLAAYTEGGEWLSAVRERLDANRHLVADAMASMGVGHSLNRATYLAWLDFTDLDLGADPAAWLLDHAKVALSPGPPFRPAGPGFARLNFGTTVGVLSEALERMATSLDQR